MKFRSRFFWKEMRKFACLFLAIVLVLSLTVGDYTGSGLFGDSTASAETTSTTVSYSDVTGSMDFSDLQVSNFSSSVMTDTGSSSASTSSYETRTIIVSFTDESMLDAADGTNIGTYETTSAGKKTSSNIEEVQKKFYQALSSEGIAYDKVYSYKNIDNAVAISIDTSYVSDIKNMDGVESVVICDTYSKPETAETTSTTATTNATSVYATGVYDSSKYVEDYGGKGMTVAILDTGLDYTHEAFRLTNDPDDYYYEYSQTFIANAAWSEDYVDNKISSGDLNASGSVYVSAKVPFAFDYSDNDDDVYPSYSNHGTHVAGIIAGRAAYYSDDEGEIVYKDGYNADNTNEYTTPDGYTQIFTDSSRTELATEEFIGVAPYAQLVICKVFTDDLDSPDIGGATTEDILAALEDCVELGVDVINMSLGSTNGFSSTDDGDDEGQYMSEVYSSIGDAGISLVVAASNDYSSGSGSTFGTNLASNPDSGTVGSPSTYSSAISVASISGKMSQYLVANAGTENETSIYFRQSADENSVDYDFVEQMLTLGADSRYYSYDSETGVRSLNIKYVVIPGVGQSTSYSNTITNIISQAHEDGYLIVALIKRGTNTFQDKVEIAMQQGVDGVIVYNNVAGEIKMTIGDIDDPIPAISTTQVTGQALVSGATNYQGIITISTDYEAGPFMSDFSSWGVTSDLKLKPEITAHGGEITSSVPGGYTEMSGTSMATPNISGLMANILSYVYSEAKRGGKFEFLLDEQGNYNKSDVTELAYQLMMSTATTVYDSDGLPYSPRKQGAGLASLENIVNTNTYLYTVDGSTVSSAHATGGYYTVETGGRPKIELGEDENKVGVYTLEYYIYNTSSDNITYTLQSLFFTESLSLDGLAVAEQAYMLAGNAVWTIGGATYSDGASVSFAPGATKISVTLTLTDSEKAYLNESFVNGMFVEGFLQLVTDDENQCSLSIPFMGFYGNWEDAPMLDYDAYEIAEIEADTSLNDEEKASETVWATQAYTMYWNGNYVLPMGSFLYSQNEDDDEVEKIYASEEYCAVSCYNDESADSSNSSSYMTSYAIKGLYAGLLRNAKYVTVTMTDATTGEEIYTKVVYRVGKAYAGGGSASPAYVKLELTPEELGLVENGTYRLEFNFFFQSMDEEITEDNTFSFSFTVDYTAPVLESASVRYVDYNDSNGNAQQKVYLDLDVYDNHYSMAVLLCYYDKAIKYDGDGNAISEDNQIVLATDYVTPVYNAVKNGTTTVTIEITDLMDLIEEGLELYAEIDDYALNHSIYKISINTATSSVLPDVFSVSGATADSKTASVSTSFNDKGELCITLGKLDTCTVSLDYDTETYSSANLSNFTWGVAAGSTSYVAVKNGQIVGLKAGSGVVTVAGAGGEAYNINVTVTESSKTLTVTGLSFGTIYNASDVPVQARGVVEVNIEQKIQLEVQYDPWYYQYVADSDKKVVDIVWSSSDEKVATVDDSGNVTIKKKGTATVMATISGTAYATSVTFSVQEAFTVSSMSLTDYTGSGGVVYIPTDMNIMSIGEEAFKDNTTITAVIIPKTVTSIGKKAFYGCTNLKYVFFVDVTTQDVADAELTLINAEAFEDCTSLEYVDFSNCKTFTVAKYAFLNCTSLKVIKGIENMGTAYDGVFDGCTSLVGSLSADSDVNLVNSITYYDGSVLTEDIDGLTNLTKTTSASDMRDVTLNLSTSETQSSTAETCVININSMDYMVNGTNNTLDITGLHVSGSYVFMDCDSLTNISMGEFTSLGYAMFRDCDGIEDVVIKTASVGAYAFYNCDKLATVTFTGITKGTIGNYAFAYNGLGNLSSVIFSDGVTISSIGSYAFAGNYMTLFTLPEGLTSLGNDLFYGGDLNNLVITTDITDVTFTGTTFASIGNITLDDAVQALAIENNLLYNKDKNKVILAISDDQAYTLLDSTTTIGSYAFSGKTNLTSITIPASVTTIESGAFNGCTNLESVTFEGTALTTIGDNAFTGTALTSVTIPEGVTSIGDYAFYYCEDLKTVTFAGTALTTIGDNAFMGTAITDITIPSSVTSVGSYAFAATPLASFTYEPTAAATLGDFVFAFTNLTDVTLDDNINTIGDGVFYYCTSLESATLGNVTSMGSVTFYGCTGLRTAAINGGSEIGQYTFYYCTALESVALADSVKEIGYGAFIECTSLATIDLSNVKTINSYAFYDCSSLADIDLSSAKVIGSFAFYGNAATTITIPAKLEATTTSTVHQLSDGAVYGIDMYYDYEYTYTSLGAGAFAGADNLTSFVVESGNSDYVAVEGVLYRVLSDGTYELIAYPSAATATSYTVIDDTIRIESYAFAYLTAGKLTEVTLPYETTSIGVGAFYSSGVTTYVFTSYIAPTLEAEVSYTTLTTDDSYDGVSYAYYMTYLNSAGGGIYRGLYNTNFEEGLINYIPDLLYCESDGTEASSTASGTSSLKISYPSNGTGYGNLVYTNYFGSKTLTSPVLTTASYTVLKNFTGGSWYDIDTINSWLTAEITDELTAIVTEFSELVKTTHANYNNMKNDSTQVELLTAALAEYGITIDLLTSTEEALSAVKERFGIVVTVSSAEADASSYRSTYTEGEYFDMTGVAVIVTYDDYTEKTFTYENGEVVLVESYNVPLTTNNNVVRVTVTEINETVGLSITVTAAETDGEEEEGGLSTGAIIGIVVGCVAGVAAVAAAVVVVLILRKKKAGAVNSEAQASEETVESKEENSEETEETEDKEAAEEQTEINNTDGGSEDTDGGSGEVD